MSFFAISMTNYNTSGYKEQVRDSVLFERMNLHARNAFAAERTNNWCIAYEGYSRASELAKSLNIEPLETWKERILISESKLTNKPKHNWNPEYGFYKSKDNYIALYKEPPIYPRRMMERGREGCVMLEFSITEEGKTDDIRVIWSTNNAFNQPAIWAAEKFIYKPNIKDGEPKKVLGVLNQITFIIDSPKKLQGYIPTGCE